MGEIFELEGLWLGEGEEKEEITANIPFELDLGTKLTVRFNWDISNKNATTGDTASVSLPDIFSEEFSNRPILLSDGETKIGTWEVTSGQLKFSFDFGEAGEIDPSKLEGTFIEFGFLLQEDLFKNNVNQEITFEISETKTFNIIATPKDTSAKTISKLGVPKMIRAKKLPKTPKALLGLLMSLIQPVVN